MLLGRLCPWTEDFILKLGRNVTFKEKCDLRSGAKHPISVSRSNIERLGYLTKVRKVVNVKRSI